MANADPVQLVDQLDPEQIAARIEELDRQCEALRVLLRAARARRWRRPSASERKPEQEVQHAS
jgi:hypothetical protein